MWAANPVHAYERHKRDDGFEADYVGRERCENVKVSRRRKSFEADYVGLEPTYRAWGSGERSPFRGRLCGAHRSFQRRKVPTMVGTCHLFDVPGGCR